MPFNPKKKLGPPTAAVSAEQAPTAREIQALSYKLVHESEDEDADDWRMLLMCSVDRLLDEGNAQTLTSVLRNLDADPRAQHFLDVLIQRAAPRARVTQHDEPWTAQLLAVPVLLNPGMACRGGDLGDAGRLEVFANSLKTFGMVDPEATIVVVEYLYHPDELASIPATRVRQLTKDLLNVRLGAAEAVDKTLAQSGWPTWNTTASPTLLRYVLLLVADDQAREEVDSRKRVQEVWLEPASELLAEALGMTAGTATVAGIASFYEGMRLGTLALADHEARRAPDESGLERGDGTAALEVVDREVAVNGGVRPRLDRDKVGELMRALGFSDFVIDFPPPSSEPEEDTGDTARQQ